MKNVPALRNFWSGDACAELFSRGVGRQTADPEAFFEQGGPGKGLFPPNHFLATSNQTADLERFLELKKDAEYKKVFSLPTPNPKP